jgi:hypothetical protein
MHGALLEKQFGGFRLWNLDELRIGHKLTARNNPAGREKSSPIFVLPAGKQILTSFAVPRPQVQERHQLRCRSQHNQSYTEVRLVAEDKAKRRLACLDNAVPWA